MPEYEFSPYSVNGHSNLLLSILRFWAMGTGCDPEAHSIWSYPNQNEEGGSEHDRKGQEAEHYRRVWKNPE